MRVQVERLKNMSLRRSFFLLTLCGLLAALILTALLWKGCQAVSSQYPSGGVMVDSNGVIQPLPAPTPEQMRMRAAVDLIFLLGCILFPAAGLAAAGMLFYRWKLKEPIRILKEGTERIRMQDLDFSIPVVSADELGGICAAFETMRGALQKSNQELWRQTEERRRLNAAFAHDLRNPVTVLKGTVKQLRRGGENAVEREQALKRLETYTLRIERYVEAMSSIQRLEQMPVRRKAVDGALLRQELEETAELLAAPRRPSVRVSVEEQCVDRVYIDHGIFLTVAENLIGNAVRFARQEVFVCLRQEGGCLILSVGDDGPGYPAALLRDGPKPFGKASEDAAHFGMGLYSSQVLCGKHGGELRLENRAKEEGGGARIMAVFGEK